MNLFYIECLIMLKRCIRKISNFNEKRIYKKEVLQVLKETQAEIIFQHRNENNNYYKNEYSKHELGFWESILNWIYYDNRKTDKKLEILDIGCKFGTLAILCKKILNADVYTIDFLPQKNELMEKYNIHFKQHNIERDSHAPFNKKFDIIIFTEVLEHLNFYPVKTLLHIKSMLKEDGVLYLSTPNAKYWGKQLRYYQKLSDIPEYNENTEKNIIDDHIWQYSLNEILEIFNESGLVPVEFDYSNNKKQFNFALKSKEDIIL